MSLEIFGDGYAGIAPVGDGEMNVCAVAAAGDVEGLRRRLMERLGIPEGVEWHRMAPLERADLAASPRAGLFLGFAINLAAPNQRKLAGAVRSNRAQLLR